MASSPKNIPTSLSPLKVLVLFDLHFEPPYNQDFEPYLKNKKDVDWDTERDLVKALRSLGHQVKLFGLFDKIDPLISECRENPPDIVFNLCESLCQDRDLEPDVASLFRVMRISYTGATPTNLTLCKDKGLTKKILAYDEIRVPRFLVSSREAPLRRMKDLVFPVIVKPLGLDASEGITSQSVVHNEKDALAQTARIHTDLAVDVIVEELIEGREIYFGVLGTGRSLRVLPPRELIFDSSVESTKRVATYSAKWDEGYRKRHGIRNISARPIDPSLLRAGEAVSKKIYRLFQMRGYGRMDLKLTPNGEWVFIEANPNPALAELDDFAQAAKKGGLEYPGLIDAILRDALKSAA